jgi:phosphotransferase system  glucose/maltose/N-acetylglucosamine-specific IIC component
MSIKQRRRILVGLILAVFIAGILVGIGGHFGEQMQHPPVIPEAEEPFGDVIVDTAAGEVRF